MKKPDPIIGFLMVYFGILGICLLVNKLVFHPYFVDSENSLFLISVAQCSLVNAQGFNKPISLSFTIFALGITQLMGILLLSYSLYFYRRLYAAAVTHFTIRSAFIETVKVSLLAELILFLFFYYAIPIELTENDLVKKLILTLGLAINSFNNAGIWYFTGLFDPEIINTSFILQLGIIAGITAGSLGIFVVDELASPINLRKRLENPLIDWSLITKISVYGTIVLLLFFSGIYYLTESNNFLARKNLTESVIASLYEISSSRGFGYSVSEHAEYVASSNVKLFASIVASGPFSTGGGLTLLSLLWFGSFFTKNLSRSWDMSVSIKLAKNLFIYILVCFSLLSFLVWFIAPIAQKQTVLWDQWEIFNTRNISIQTSSRWFIDLLKSFTLIAGRISFVIISFLTLRKLHC